MTKDPTKTNYFFLLALIIYLPFASLTAEVLSSFGLQENVVFWLAHFYEPILVLLFLTSLSLFIKKIIKSSVALLSLALLVLGAVNVFIGGDLSQSLQGYRFALFFLLAFFVAYVWPYSSGQKNTILKTYVWVASIIAVWAMIERFLPAHYWTTIGFDANFGYGSFMAGNFFRSVSSIGGPNQLGSYLLPAFFILIIKSEELKLSSTLRRFLAIVIVVAIFFAMSRAAIAGLLIGLIAYLLLAKFPSKAKIVTYLSGGCALILAAISYLYLKSSAFAEMINHGSSQYWHLFAMRTSLERFQGYDIFHKILGEGLGTNGPLSVKFGSGIISESWYLQTLLESGVAGLLLWLALIVSLTIILYKKISDGLLYGFISVIITSLFLHTLADNPALSYSLFILIGLSLNHTKYEKNSN